MSSGFSATPTIATRTFSARTGELSNSIMSSATASSTDVRYIVIGGEVSTATYTGRTVAKAEPSYETPLSHDEGNRFHPAGPGSVRSPTRFGHRQTNCRSCQHCQAASAGQRHISVDFLNLLDQQTAFRVTTND